MASPQTPIAIVGMGCLFPNAPGLREFWRLIRCGLDGITDVPPTHWSADDFFDADPKTPDKTYCRRGGFLSTTLFDSSEFGIPPSALEATDTAQLLALVVAKSALRDAGYDDVQNAGGVDASTGARTLDRDRVSVILGVTGTQELVIPLGARLGHPIWRKALRQAGVADAVADDVVRRIGDAYVGWQENSFPGLLGNVVAGRIANRLDLHGTNCVVDAACASSLSAVHLAMMELHNGRADVVLSGGVDALNDIFMHMCFSKTPALSPSGDVRPFASDGDGTVLGEGIGIITLKRLADAERDGDRVYAVIRGIGTSSDGRQNSIYAPDASGQALALRRAYDAAGIDPATVELIEAHGTGTKVGDVVEFEALRSVFGGGMKDGGECAMPASPRCQSASRLGDTAGELHAECGMTDARSAAHPRCAIGSVKSQIGHTKAAAGAASLIKAALALHHKTLPPTIKVRQPNPKLGIDDSPFYISPEARPWILRGAQPRRAAVSSFGFGGSNFHVVLEEHAGVAAKEQPAWDGAVEIIALGAASRDDLTARLANLAEQLKEPAQWNDVRRAAFENRREYSSTAAHRLVMVTERPREQGPRPGAIDDPALPAVRRLLADAQQALAREASASWALPNVFRASGPAAGQLAMVFSGQGSHYVGMARELACVFPEIRESFTALDADPVASRISEFVYPVPAFAAARRQAQVTALTCTEIAQPALAALGSGMLRLLGRFGVSPDLAAGHSFGELTALHAAGRFDTATLFRLARLRGRLMAEKSGDTDPTALVRAPSDAPRDAGTMLAVEAPLEAIAAMIGEERADVVLANRNAPAQGVLSGSREAIRGAVDACHRRGWRTKELTVSAAFHSRQMEAAAIEFRRGLRKTDIAAGDIPVYSNVTGRPYPDGASATRGLLGDQLISPVNFVDMMEAMYAAGARAFVEVGPKSVLTGLMRLTLQGRPAHVMAVDASGGSRGGVADLARVLAQLATLGHAVDLKAWETPPPAMRKAKMAVPLVGANYRAPAKGERNAPASGQRGAAVKLERTTQGARGLATEPVVVSRGPESTAPVRRAIAEDPYAGGLEKIKRRDEMQHLTPIEHGISMSGQPVNGELLLDALKVVQDGLRAMQALQQQTAEAHQRFLESQAHAHRTFQAMIEGQQRLLERAMGLGVNLPAAPTAPAAQHAVRSVEPLIVNPPIYMPPAARAAEALATPRVVAPRALERDRRVVSPARPAPAPRTDPLAPREPTVAPRIAALVSDDGNGLTKPAAIADGLADRFSATLVDVVAELTGYPKEMLELDMDMEADLGIDSIKRVEILAAVQERVPEVTAANPEYMGSLRTLRQIVEHSAGGNGGVAAAAKKK